ncbi:hypothetical protein GN157_11410 [Flavobacterium rakeshii]|uniref:PpiC domain-containing protein n=1 Tax=Flavobacterium rakeshii TaxID=1038845 RepID=A0A6N8HF31_9FLAO|nr:hypothetical protein [Flavobacterium rakeshii]MUV04317.1 hypothetical protein [Flavobacterium rakeshii]
MKKLFILAFIFYYSLTTAQSIAKDTLLKRDIDLVIEEVKFMYDYDQALREYTLFKTFDKSKTDSIENLESDLTRKYIVENKFKSDTLSKHIFKNYINHFDDLHTKRIIELTKKYGFPSKERLELYSQKELGDEFNPYILLVHAPKAYWEELKVLMKQELLDGTVDRCKYGHLLWHFNGRKDVNDLLNNGFEYIEDEDGTKRLSAVNCD